MKKFIRRYIILTTPAFILALVLLYILFSPIQISPNVPKFLIPFVSTFFGASFAFYLNSTKDTRKKDDDRISALRVALFTVAKQQDTLAQIWRVIREWKDRPDQLVNMGPMTLADSSYLRQDMAALSFMIPLDPTLLLELTIEDERFSQAMTAITRHAEFHVKEIQPALEKSALDRPNAGLAELEKALGARIFGTAITNANQIFKHVEPTRKSLSIMMPRIFQFAKNLYPDEKFLKIDLPIEEHKVTQRVRIDYSPPRSSKCLVVLDVIFSLRFSGLAWGARGRVFESLRPDQ